MSRCSHVRRDLPLFIGGDLAALRTGEIRRHLRDCPACRREAVGLQQSRKRLQRIVDPALVAAVADESLFTCMQAAIVDRVDAELLAGAGGPPVPSGHRLWWSAAAAAALFVIGWWLVQPSLRPAALERAPLAVPVGHAGAALVQPYAGPPVPLRLLGGAGAGDANPGGGSWAGGNWAESGLQPGMMGRWRLRSLVGEGPTVPLPGVEVPSGPPEAAAPAGPRSK